MMDFVASAVMNKDVKTICAEQSVSALEQRLVELGVHGLPVMDGSAVVGVVSKTDLVEALHPPTDLAKVERVPDDCQASVARGPVGGGAESRLTVRDIMSTDVVSVGPNAGLHQVADMMYRKRLHRILVLENSELVGIITPFDFVRLYAKDQIGMDGRPSSTLDF